MELKRGPEHTDCGYCGAPAKRIGAQDGSDVYRCADGHLTHVPLALGQRKLQEKEEPRGR